MESKHVLHAGVAALLTDFASGGLEFTMTGELTPLIAGVPGVLVGCAYLVAVHFLPKRKKLISRVRKIGQWTQKRPLKTIAEGPTPDGTLPELIQHMQSAGIDLDRSFYEIEDKARLGQLACWGRRYSVAGPGRNPNPLRDIPQEHWDHYALDVLRCAVAQANEEASLCCTRPRSSNFREHDYNGPFQDLRVNRPQAMALWPSSKGKET